MAYIGSSPTKVVSRQSANIFTYTATANQTAFTGADANGNTLACTPSDIMVHMNGIKLEESDYTASTTTVTLGSGASAGDEVTITAFLTFESADHYTKSAADTRYVNATGDTMSGNLTTTGNVGVGETSPNLGSSGTGLHIKGAASKDGVIKLDSQTANRSGIVQFTENGTDKWRIGYDATSNHLEFTRSGVADRMLISDDGYVTTPSQPAFVAHTVSTSTLANGATPIFNNTATNRGNIYNTSNGRFTAPLSGLYSIGAHIRIHTTTGTISYHRLSFKKNGSYIQHSRGRLVARTSGNYSYIANYLIIELSTNDYITTAIESGAGATMNLSSMDENAFYGHLIG